MKSPLILISKLTREWKCLRCQHPGEWTLVIPLDATHSRVNCRQVGCNNSEVFEHAEKPGERPKKLPHAFEWHAPHGGAL